jgi:hypothetical protein
MLAEMIRVSIKYLFNDQIVKPKTLIKHFLGYYYGLFSEFGYGNHAAFIDRLGNLNLLGF